MSVYVENSTFSTLTMADLETDGGPIPVPPDPPPCSMHRELLQPSDDTAFKPNVSVGHENLIHQPPGTWPPIQQHVHSASANHHHHGATI